MPDSGRTRYHRISNQDVQALIRIAGGENVVSDPEKLIDYGHDEATLVKPHLPHLVVKPHDTATVSQVLKYANRKKIAVTPRGAGTGLSGGCVPLHGGIVLSLENMHRVLEIDSRNFAAVVEPGVPLGALRQQVESVGLTYPVSLGEMTATVAGSIATNAGGLNAVKHGVTRHHVLGLEAVLADGRVVRTGGKFVKCSSGYDLTQLLVGSEGTLAIVTEVTLKLNTKPAHREALFVPFHTLEEAIGSVPDILLLGKELVGLEFMEKSIMEIAEAYTGKKLPYQGFEAFLLILAEGNSMDDIHAYFYEVERVVKNHGAADALVPPGQRAMKSLLEARESFYHAISKYAPMQILDAVVPRSEIARFVSAVKSLEPKYGIEVIVYGHAGDGNVHLHPICKNMPVAIWKRKLQGLMRDIYALASRHGGAVSGEHGIGIDKRAFFERTADGVALKTMRQIKDVMDPAHILNPGKIFA